MKNILPIFLIVVSVVGFYVYIQPQYAALTALQATEGQYRDALAKTSQLVELYNQLADKYNKFPTEDLNRLNTMIPDTSDNVRLIMDINNIAGSHGISIKNAKTSYANAARVSSSFGSASDMPSNPYQKTTITVTFKSQYGNLVAFVRDLEKSLRIMDVRTIAITPPPGSATDLVNMPVSLSLDAYSVEKAN